MVLPTELKVDFIFKQLHNHTKSGGIDITLPHTVNRTGIPTPRLNMCGWISCHSPMSLLQTKQKQSIPSISKSFKFP